LSLVGHNPGIIAARPGMVVPIKRLLVIIFCVTALGASLALQPFAKASPASSNGLYPDFQPTGDIRRFLGEILHYDISFLWFENAAEASVGFYQDKDGNYYSLLEAETKGFVGFFTSYRKHVYRATFEVLDGGTRVRSKKFERKVIIGNQVESTQNTLDYSTRVQFWYRYDNNVLVETGQREIPGNVVFDDILAAFYNFRNGVYGKVARGENFTIYTIPDKGQNEFRVSVLDGNEEKKVQTLAGKPVEDNYILDVKIPPEVFKTKNGELQFWASKNLIPTETLVEDYILLGDLYAKLNRRDLIRTSRFGFFPMAKELP